ncbi:MAG: DJ-1/PfpI family protein [Deltaproteobacteria bacterium]|jgi:transcriptional regulator GlxA family with amidase domain|nr:DJ-1/PfpI family protein [Deltaproteobacteria bacterium]
MNIGIYIYDQAEVLDFSGPFEVFSVANRLAKLGWSIWLIGVSENLVEARGAFKVMPHYSIQNVPALDLLIVVGGVHLEEVHKREVIDWITETAEKVQVVVSICTGAFLLAEAGLLDGLEVTTHWEEILDLQRNYPNLQVREGVRWIEQGKLFTAAGISAGIDLSLELVSKFAGEELAERTAQQMEYAWSRAGT